jgi:hypothetical protein
MRWLRSLFVVAVAAGLVLTPIRGAGASTPGSGTLADDGTSTSWSGSFVAPDPAAPSQCPTGQEPFCDTFALTVPSLAPGRPDVRIDVLADDPNDILQLYIYGPTGTLVAEDTSVSANLHATLDAPAPGAYSVRVEAALFAPPSDGSYRANAQAVPPAPRPSLDDEGACSDTVTVLTTPPEVIQAGLADDGRRVRLDVHVLLDDVPEAFAREFFTFVAKPYAEIGIDVAPTFEDATGYFAPDITATTDMIARARTRYPDGKVPAQWDIVEVLTKRDVQALGQTAVAGQADCLGGIAFKTRSYEVSESGVPGIDESGIAFGPLTLDAHFAAKVTSHEMGHLLGGQHHYANCVEGIDPAEELAGDTSPCTLMFNAADGVSLHFGALNAKVVRGYALLYAAENDAVEPPPVVPEIPGGVVYLPLAALAMGALAVFALRRRPVAG